MKKIYYSFLRITGRKEIKYRIFLFFSLIIGLFFTWKMLVLSKSVYQNIKMRTPLNNNSYIVLDVPNKTALFFAVGTHLYSYDPNFELAGFISSIEKSHRQGYKYLTVSVLDEHKERVLQKNTSFKLMNTSPSFYSILNQSIKDNKENQYLFSLANNFMLGLDEKRIGKNLKIEFEERGFLVDSCKIKINKLHTSWTLFDENSKDKLFSIREEKSILKVYGTWNQLAKKVSYEQGKNYQKIVSIFGKKLQENGLDAKKVQEILADSFIQEQIFSTLNVEILQKVDFEKALKDVPHSKEAQKLLNDMNFGNIMFSAAEGLLVGGKDYLYEEANKYESKTYFGDVMNWGYLTYRMVFNRDEVLNEGFKYAGGKALELGWGQTFRSLKDTAKKNPEALKSMSKDVLGKLDVGSHLGSGLRALLYNEKLKTYIKNKYGEKSLDAFLAATGEIATDKEVASLLEETKSVLEKQVVDMTSNVLLNKNKSGINPAFLSFARERLLGKKEAQVIYFANKEDSPVQSGHTYEWYNKKTQEGNVISYVEGDN